MSTFTVLPKIPMEEMIIQNWPMVVGYLPNHYREQYNLASHYVQQGIVNPLVIEVYNVAMFYANFHAKN